MPQSPVILVIGTGDTKTPELLCLRETILAKGGKALMMDVGVVGEPDFAPEIRKEDVAAAAGRTIPELIAMEDENISMAAMAEGASTLARQLHADGQIDGMIALGGTMGTDLAFDVALALPIGVSKMVISSVAYSHLVPPERIAADLMMILWAGGLWGVNSISRAVLEQAAGAVVGACRPDGAVRLDKPAVAVSALGQASLKYMKRLEPELSRRGYDAIVFHAVGIGGRAMESLIAQDAFVAVLDLALIEVSDDALGSCVTGGESRLRTAGRKGVPQIVAPGAIDGLDFATWAGIPPGSERQDTHAHNRLISVAKMTLEQRRRSAEEIVARLAEATGPLRFILPLQGFDEWDREGGPMHDPEGHAAQVEVFRRGIDARNRIELDAHINDDIFTETVMKEFDTLVRDGLIAPGRTE
ncbi:Tm-1-like ATP-binding domain-containing protein [Tropicibacter alexandrii]|uniref:Tm-1-like ATP-binding domain-containing protein n=1 Tax=Tropicibacter alexandrii TaxID=2267683 RepID=UPI000EF5026A|nr:Tm-1-like ATP-binding domain-containing protein [Tropicibacter alexandrii]